MSSSPAREAQLKKQGAYGKVKTHSEGKLAQLMHVDEVAYALYYKVSGGLVSKLSVNDDDTRFCDDKLGAVSRSFAAVIRQLPEKCCLDVLIFYLVLRALDTVEDDMEAFGKDSAVKINHLRTFYRVALEDPSWSMDGVGEGDEKELLQQFSKCVRVYQRLTPASKAVISDVTKRMGEGMADFVDKDLGEGTQTVDEYNRYCYYVAGLVGEGLTRLFHACGYESAEFEKGALDPSRPIATHKQGGLDKSMGLFLQKTNIIRDYLEDYVDGRAFWPKEVWSIYATETKSLGEFAHPAPGSPEEARSLACLNHLVTDALELVPDCISYMKMLTHQDIFRFCAIPQVMAIATLDKVFNNPQVFTGVVKVRKGLAVKMIMTCDSQAGIESWFYQFAVAMRSRVPASDPNRKRTLAACDAIIDLTKRNAPSQVITMLTVLIAFVAAVFAYMQFML